VREGQRRPSLEVLDQRRRGVRFLAHPIRSILNPPESTGIGCWSLNPYVGCEFGCTYCYARYAHRYVVERAQRAGLINQLEAQAFRGTRGWEGFEQQIFVKDRSVVLAALEHDLPRVQARYARGEGEPVLIGTATDPYQPAERRFAITRAVLERFLRAPPLGLGLITKSPLITRDLDVLLRLSRIHRVTMHLSLISTSRKLVRCFEPRSPMPHARLRALKKLTDSGLNAGVLVAPILPGITDTEANLSRLLAAARRQGARFAHPSPLRMYRAVRPVFLPVVERHYPKLLPRYELAYRRVENAPREYVQALKARFVRLAAAAGLPTEDYFGDERALRGGPQQLTLWANAPSESR
jgi:DNA repair photolyase